MYMDIWDAYECCKLQITVQRTATLKYSAL